MIELGETLISEDILEKQFVCDLNKCKGACCVEGDAGAPVTIDEIEKMEEVLDKVLPYLPEKAKKIINEKGVSDVDDFGELVTPIINGKECVYAFYDESKTLKCGFEQAFKDGKTDWYKPISCHLYPIRAKKYDDFTALNYDKWSICKDACSLGEELGVEVYKFVKEALIRAYGEEWYSELELVAEGLNKLKRK